MPRLFLSVLCAAVLCATPTFAAGQQRDLSAPAHVSSIEGKVLLEREGSVEDLALNMPLLAGDRLRTQGGRVEMLLPDGSVLALDRESIADLLDGGLVRLTEGRLVFVVASDGAGQSFREYQVDAPGGAVRIAAPGEYRVSSRGSTAPPVVDLSVVRGQATLAGDRGSLVVNAGERSSAAAGDGPAPALRFNSAQTDGFYAWADERRAERVGARSNSYLPEELRVYGGTLERYGTWQEAPEPGIGYVWYPRVAVDWRPYYYGSWWSYPSWGWTWVGYDPWAWPTHHYGRWGFGVGGWYWIPNRYWGPAWVAWGGAPGYTAWCPLGYWGGPVFSFGVHVSFGGHSYSHWHGWSVVPHHAFARPYHHVGAHAVHGGRLPAGTRNAFAVHDQGPRGGHAAATARTAVPRSWAGAGTAVPRANGGSRPAYDTSPAGSGRAVAAGGRQSDVTPFAGAPRASYGGTRPSYATTRQPSGASVPSYSAPTPGAARPSPGGARPSYGGTRPSYATTRQPSGASVPSYSAPTPGARSSPGGARPSFGASTTSSSRPSYATSRPSYSTARPAYGTSRPSYSSAPPNGARPSYGGARPSFGGPSPGAARPSYSPARPSYNGPSPGAQRPSYGGSRPSYGGAAPRGFSGSPSALGAPSPSNGGPRPSYGGAVPRGPAGVGGTGAGRSPGGGGPSGGARPSGGATPSGGARRR